METTSSRTNYYKYTFQDYTGYIVAPWLLGATHELVSIRHSASEEYYFLFQGELQLLVEGSLFTLKPHEILMVKSGVSHTVVGGQGPVEHLGFRMPAPDDSQATGEIPLELVPATEDTNRYLQLDWGFRIPLTDEWYQNCWLFGFDIARFRSDHMCLAYERHLTDKSVEAVNQKYPDILYTHRIS